MSVVIRTMNKIVRLKWIGTTEKTQKTSWAEKCKGKEESPCTDHGKDAASFGKQLSRPLLWNMT